MRRRRRSSTDVIVIVPCLSQSSFFTFRHLCAFSEVFQSTHVANVKPNNTSAGRRRNVPGHARSPSLHFTSLITFITSSTKRRLDLNCSRHPKYPSPHLFHYKQDIQPCPSASPTIPPTRPPKPSRIRSWKHVTVSSDPRYTHLMCLFCCLLIVCHWPPYPRGFMLVYPLPQ